MAQIVSSSQNLPHPSFTLQYFCQDKSKGMVALLNGILHIVISWNPFPQLCLWITTLHHIFSQKNLQKNINKYKVKIKIMFKNLRKLEKKNHQKKWRWDKKYKAGGPKMTLLARRKRGHWTKGRFPEFLGIRSNSISLQWDSRDMIIIRTIC